MKRASFQIIFISLLIAGCTTWVKQGVSDYDRDVDLASCTAIGYDRFRSEIITYKVRDSYYEPIVTTCKTDKDDKEKCTTKGGVWHPSEYSSYDAQGGTRSAFVEDCMYHKGYDKKSFFE
ncbi:hypothetical protein [Collimonas pratensis]|uniref:hypothetical protein n=1 Tax=Collimonas pratensis TaxID=279113 RepID=UPI001237965F|nr:hypothetical protein [Collimonas pratensis]